LLESASRWLSGRSKTLWATTFGHSELMQAYAKDLLEIVRALRQMHLSCPRCNGLVGQPLGRNVDPMDCHVCVRRTVVIDATENLHQVLKLAHAHTSVFIKWPAYEDYTRYLTVVVETSADFQSLSFDTSVPYSASLRPSSTNMITFGQV